MHSCSLVRPQFDISAKCQGNKDGELRYVCRLPQVPLQAADSRIKTHNFKHSMWSLAHFVTIAPESRTRRKPKRTKPCLCWLLVEIELTALHTAGISCPSLSVRMMDADPLRVVFLPLERTFLLLHQWEPQMPRKRIVQRPILTQRGHLAFPTLVQSLPWISFWESFFLGA